MAATEYSLQNLIDGMHEQPTVKLPDTVYHAGTDQVLLQQRAADRSQVERALASADAMHRSGEWSGLAAEIKADLLDSVAAELDKRAEAIAEADSRCTGAILGFTRQVGSICGAAFRAAANLLRNPPEAQRFEGPYGPLSVDYLPLGPAALISPWNAPSGITCHKLASALAAGCPVVIKPSEWAPVSAQFIVDAVVSAGLPAGLVQLIHGDADTGAAIVSDPRIAAVSFTGGLAGGRAVAAACARDIKPAQLELGGNNPMVVLPGADIEHTAASVVSAMTSLNGQWCRALGRLLVHESLHDELLQAVNFRLRKLKIGSPLDPSSQMGPLVHQGHWQHVTDAVEAYRSAGAELHAPSPLPEGPGNWFSPTLVCGLNSSDTLEEIFGPVAAVHTFAEESEAVALANEAPYGLAAYVFGPEPDAFRVSRQITSGMVKINAVTLMNLHPMAPRPAWRLSGIGEEGTVETFRFFQGTRVIGVGHRSESGA